MDWYHNTHYSDPDDDHVLLSATCQNCGATFYVYADALIDGQIPGGELCGACEQAGNLTQLAADVCPRCGGSGVEPGQLDLSETCVACDGRGHAGNASR